MTSGCVFKTALYANYMKICIQQFDVKLTTSSNMLSERIP